MKIQSVHIRNFRKLKNCIIDFADKETVFVGANNSGKTSAISAIVWFLQSTEKFSLKEFTASNWDSINQVGVKWLENEVVDRNWLDPRKWDDIVPSMDVWIEVEDGEQYMVSHLIPSLKSWDGKIVGVRFQFEPKDVQKLYIEYKEAKEKVKNLENTDEWKNASSPKLYPKDLYDFLSRGSIVKDFFKVKYYVIDYALKTKENSVQNYICNELGSNPLLRLIKVDYILASRDFSDPEGQTDNEIDTLSRQFQQYYKSSGKENEDLTKDSLDLFGSIIKANKTYDEKLTKVFEFPIKELQNINYPGFQNPQIQIKSNIQIEEAIKHDSAVQFAIQGGKDLVLPEKYNGLGYRNLISIYFKLIYFRESWLSKLSKDDCIEPIHIVFIEEPEAHLHAQAQQVFVKRAFDALSQSDKLTKTSGLRTQLVLSTHSNHIVNALDFSCMRYFKRAVDYVSKFPISKVVNLSNIFGKDEETKRFVTRYIRLTHCDIFFADAVIFVEGAAEKILLPRFIENENLSSYFISIIEINGRHAHRFRNLIEKLGIATLIVTDIDATVKSIEKKGKADDKNEKNQEKITKENKKYIEKQYLPEINKGMITGNPTIKDWLDGTESLDALLELKAEDKIVGNHNVRLAYQTPINVEWENNNSEIIYPYTFEDSLIFTNLSLFKGKKIKKYKEVTTVINQCNKSISAKALQLALLNNFYSSNFSKASFVVNLLYTELFDKLVAPKYIEDGLKWIRDYLDSNGISNDNK